MSAIPPGKLPEVPIPPETSRPGGIGGKVENVLLRFGLRWLNGVKALLSSILSFGLETFLDVLKPVLRIAYEPLLRMVTSAPGCPAELKTAINAALTVGGEAGAVLTSMLGQSVAGAAVGSITGTLFAGATRFMNVQLLPSRPGLGDMLGVKWRGKMPANDVLANAAEGGWSSTWLGLLEDVARPRPDILTMAQDSWRRGVDLESLRYELRSRGYMDPDIDTIFRVLQQLPGPGDLVRMAVREAFSADAIARYQLHSDFPVPFAEWMKKQGYSEEWARNFWAAHWELPSATMGMEMLHRGIIDSEGFSLLLRVLDISPYWRPKIEAMSYSPYTRVDVRRMYQIGVISSYAELVRAYKDLGYDDTKADKLAQFTVLEYGESEKEATKSDVLQAYEIGRLSGSEAMVYLSDMGYPDWVIRMYIARVDLARSNKLASQRISSAKTLYVNGQFSKSDVYTELNRVPLPASEIERYLEEWEVPRLAKVARPTRADLLKWFVQNVLAESDFRTELAGFRLSARYIEWYVADAKRTLLATAQKMQADAVLAVAKVRLATIKSAADIRAAEIDVEIASLNLALADLRVAASPDMPYEQVVEIDGLISQATRQIKVWQLEKARVKMSYLKEKGVS